MIELLQLQMDRLIDSALIIFAFTVGSFLLAFLFCMGSCAFYRIPADFGEPRDPFKVFYLFGSSLILLLVLYVYSITNLNIIYILTTLVSFSLAAIAAVDLRYDLDLPARVFLVLYLLISSLIMIWCLTDGNSGELIELEVGDLSQLENAILDGMFWRTALLVGSIGVQLAGLFFEIGFFMSKSKRVYLVDLDKGMIVLASFKDNKVVLGHFDPSHPSGFGNKTTKLVLRRQYSFGSIASLPGSFEWFKVDGLVVQRGNLTLPDFSLSYKKSRS